MLCYPRRTFPGEKLRGVHLPEDVSVALVFVFKLCGWVQWVHHSRLPFPGLAFDIVTTLSSLFNRQL